MAMSDIALRFAQVTKSYGGVPALSDFSLEVRRGAFFGLVGVAAVEQAFDQRGFARAIDADHPKNAPRLTSSEKSLNAGTPP